MAGEWHETTLGDVVELKRGYDLPKQSRSPDNVPLVSSSGVTDRHSEAMVKGPGVVTGRYGTLGQVFYIKEDFWPLNRTLYIRDFKGNDPRFFSYFLRSLDFLAFSDKAAVPGLNRNHLHQAKVRIPIDVGEQRAIAYILGTLDDKIELNRRMNETLEEMARAIFKSWFVDFDPVRAKAEGRDPGLPKHIADRFSDRFEDSELGKIPAGWTIRPFSEVCESIFSGGTPRTTEKTYWDGGIPWLSSGETRSMFIIGTEKTITPEGVTNSSTRFARAGVTVVASAGQGHTRGQAAMLTLGSYINQSVVAMVADRNYISDTQLFFDLKRRYEEFRQISDAHSSRGSLTTKLLGSLQTTVAPRGVVEAFDQVAVPIVRKAVSTLEQSRLLTTARDTLLLKLISGELRVEDAQRMLEAKL